MTAINSKASSKTGIKTEGGVGKRLGSMLVPSVREELRQWGWAVLGGFMLTAAFPKVDFDLLIWFAMTPLLWALKDVSPGQAFRVGFVAGVAHYATLMYWLVDTMYTHGHLSYFIAVPLLFLLASYLALYPAIWSMGVALTRRPVMLLLLGPLLWVALEYIRAIALTGFPWELLGHALYRRPRLIQITDIFGVYGLSWLIVFCNVALGILLTSRFGSGWQGSTVSKKFAAWTLGVAALGFFLTIGYGELRIRSVDRQIAGAERVGVAAVQGNIAQEEKWERYNRIPTVEKYLRLSLQASLEPPGLVVWPETAMPFYFRHYPRLAQMVIGQARRTDIHYLVGSPDGIRRDDGGVEHYNAAFMVTPDGLYEERYAKVHLVPFGEYVPMQRFLPFVRALADEVIGDFKTGRKGDTLPVGEHKVGVLICYEGVFAYLANAAVQNGADILTNITNDAWYGFSSAPYQHYSMSVFRAVETKRGFVRAANSGVSALVDPAGRILKQSPLFEDAVVAGELPILDEITLYTRFGDIFAWTALLVSIGWMGSAVLKHRKKR